MPSLYEVLVTKALAADTNYAAEDILSEHTSTGTVWTFAGVAERNGGSGEIRKVKVSCETTGLTHRVRVYFYNTAPTCEVDDNKANNGPIDADVIAGYCIGYCDVPSLSDLGANSEAIATPNTPGSNLPMQFTCASDADDLIGILVTRDAITGETATDNMSISLGVRRFG